MHASSHLRVQLTLLDSAAGRHAARPAAEFRTILVSPGRRHFAAAVFPAGPLVPGGAAIHCEVQFQEPEAVAHFPAGTQFDVWEDGRRGYGTTLGVIS